jgi:hypothetical protein
VVFLKILPDVLSFLRCSCSFKSRSIIPLLLSWHVRYLLSNVHPFEVPLAILSLVPFFHCLCSTVGPVWLRPVRRATPAWQVISLWAAANFFQYPPLD